MQQFQRFLGLLSILVLTACGGGGGSSQLLGTFIDDPVGGLAYSCVSASQTIAGTTNDQGQFSYVPGQTCTFKVGNVTIGSIVGVPADGKVTPQDVAGVSRSATSAPSALAIAQFLQSLNDGSSSGKIVIPTATSDALKNAPAITLVTSSGSVSQADLRNLVVTVAGKTLVSASAAQGALDKQIAAGVVDKTQGAVAANAPVTLNSIAVTTSIPSNAAGFTSQLAATGYYSDGTTKDLTSNVSWSSSDTSLVTVDSSAVAKGLKKGAATLTASITPQGSTASIKGSVLQTTTDPLLQTIAISNTANPPAGLTDQLTATGNYSDGSTADLTKSVTWSSSDSKTVSVDANGLAKGLLKGSATVSATYSPSSTNSTTVVATSTETVVDPTPINIVISYVTSGITSIKNTASTAIQAILNFTDSTQQVVSSAVKWVVSTINGGGTATIGVNAQANTATLTGTAPGLISTVASYLGLSSNSLSLTVNPSISGMAATGSAMMSASITVTDATGKTTTTTALDDGSFNFDDLTGFTLPYQLSANVLMGEKNITLYSVVAALPTNGTNTVNINTLTSAILALVAPDGTVADLTPAQLAGVTQAQIDTAVSKIQTVIGPVANNITGAANFNPITTPFTANGKGPDALLDHISVNISTSGVSLANKMVAATGDSTAAASSSVTKTAAATPLSAGDAVDLSAIDGLVTQFKKCFAVAYTDRLKNKTTTSATLHTDCQGIATSDYSHNGNTFISRWAGMLNTQYADSTSKIFRPEMRLRLSANTIAMNFNMTDNQGNGYTMPEVIQKQADGSWKLYGNQRAVNAFVEGELTHYLDMTPNTTYNNVNFSRVDAGFRLYFDPRVTFDAAGNPINQGIDLTKNDGNSTNSWSTTRTSFSSSPMVKCVVVTGPGSISNSKWMGFHPNGLLMKRASGSTLQDYLAIDSTLSTAQSTAVTSAQIGNRVTFLNSSNQQQDICSDGTGGLDAGGVTTNSNSVYTVDLAPLTGQTNPVTGKTDTTIDGRDKRWNTGPNFARTAPDAALQQKFNNNPNLTFYVIDTDNKLRMKFDARYLGNLPTVADAKALVDQNKLSVLSKDSITSYLDYSSPKNAVTSVSLSWTNPTNGFNTDRLGFYSNVHQGTPGTGLRGASSIVTANKTSVGTDGLWSSDSSLAAELDALTGTNFYWRFASITKGSDASSNCTGNFLVSSLNTGVARAKTSVSNQGINGTWLGNDTQSTACKKVVSATDGQGNVTYPTATNTYLHREIWLRTYTSSNVRVYRYWSKKNIS